MANVVVVGAEGSGRTFFLGLFYTALVSYGGERGDRFRFHAPPKTLDLLGRLYENLRAGEAPQWPADGPASLELSLQFAEGTVPGLLARLRHPAPAPVERAVSVLLQRTPSSEVDRFLSSGGALTALGQALVEGGGLIIVLDSTLLRLDDGTSRPLPHAWDATVAALLRSVRAAVRDHPMPSQRRLDPIFVLTKHDRLSPKVRSALLPEGGTMDGWTAEKRGSATRSLLHQFLPRTEAELAGSLPPNFQWGPPTTFLSWVRTETGPTGAMRLQGHTTATRGWEPDYPALEYRDLIERIGTLG